MRWNANEWVGGRLPFPGYVIEPAPFRPDVVLWLELPDGLVVWTKMLDPKEPFSLAASLSTAATRPIVGPPRRPDRVRVADPALAAELRAAHPSLNVVVAPTPELRQLVETMAREMPGDRVRESYLENAIPVEAVARLFDAAKFLWTIAPWELADDDHVIRVDMPALGVEGACLSIIGALGESLGFILFPSFEGYEAFLGVADRAMGEDGPVDLGTTCRALHYDRAADLPASMRREIKRHGWPVAGPRAYPRADCRDRDGIRRPLTERDVRVMAAVATSLGAFFVKHGGVFRCETFEPVCESWFDENDLEVRFTAPYHAYHLFEIAPPPHPRPTPAGDHSASPWLPKVARNAPCPCGSGRKYKKCCLANTDAHA